MEWCGPFGLEDQFGGGVDAAFEGAGGERVEGGLDAGEDGDAADAGFAFGAFELVAAVGLFDAEESSGAVDVLPAEGAQFAEAQAGAERDVVEVDVEVVGFVAAERVGWGEREQGFADRGCVFGWGVLGR